MDNTYIKLFRKLVNHSLFKPGKEKDLRVFLWILLNVDYTTGEMECGRFRASESLGLSAGTFYDILRRCSRNHQVIAIKSNNKNTQIRVLKWSKFQGTRENPTANPTTNQQQTNNPYIYKEYKEIKNKNNIIYQEYKKEEKTSEKSQPKDPSPYEEKIYREFTEAGLPIPQTRNLTEYLTSLTQEQAWKYAEIFGGRSI